MGRLCVVNTYISLIGLLHTAENYAMMFVIFLDFYHCVNIFHFDIIFYLRMNQS